MTICSFRKNLIEGKQKERRRAVGSGDQILVARVFPQQGALPGVDRDDSVARGEGMGCILGGHTGLVKTVITAS
jgi:hypothetical protein